MPRTPEEIIGADALLQQKSRERNARYRDRHRERIRAKQAARYYENHDYELAQRREYYRALRARRAPPPRKIGLALIEEMSIPEPNTGCWLWLGAVDRKGYGRVSKSRHGFTLAHRYAFASAGGVIGELNVLHRCDQPGCVNPEHLWPGTPKDNTQDMVRKGRARGRNSRKRAT